MTRTDPAAPGDPGTGDLEIRRAVDDDLGGILQLLAISLNWGYDADHERFYAWKHLDNPFGASPTWVAVAGGRIAGVRIWLRWRFTDGIRTYEAVRAVDTATHPDHRGQGVFTRLTLHSLEELREQGVDFVFNTPNDASRPGYLKMGWQRVGRLPVVLRPSLVGVARTLRARQPAERWSAACEAGLPATEVLDGLPRVEELLSTRVQPVASAAAGDAPAVLRTDLDTGVLRWRYGFEPLAYRAIPAVDLDGADANPGLVVFRLRRRGPAQEAVVCLLLADDPVVARRLLRAVAHRTGADHVLHMAGRSPWRAGFVPMPGQGPVLCWREVTEPAMPPQGRWGLTMGDIELF